MNPTTLDSIWGGLAALIITGVTFYVYAALHRAGINNRAKTWHYLAAWCSSNGDAATLRQQRYSELKSEIPARLAEKWDNEKPRESSNEAEIGA